jgi:folate-binding protein YgfZ
VYNLGMARLPLHDAHLAAGAKLETVEGWELPLAYGDAGAEYTAVRRACGVLDRSHHGIVEVTGRDRATFLHALLSNDVTGLGPGQGCGATLLDVHGKVQVVLVVWALADRILLVTPPGMATATLEALDHYLFSEKAVLTDLTGSLALLVLAGPDAPAVAEGVEAMARLGRDRGDTGEREAWLAMPTERAGAAWAAAVAAGARPVGLTAFESLRIEAGTPRFGADVGPSVLLPEIPLEPLVSYTKGCYPGQEVVVRIRDRGHVNRHLRGLVLTDDAVPPAGSEVVAGDAVVGAVSSATHSLGLDRPIALAMVRRQHGEPGAAVGVRVGDRVVPATVSALPFAR